MKAELFTGVIQHLFQVHNIAKIRLFNNHESNYQNEHKILDFCVYYLNN